MPTITKNKRNNKTYNKRERQKVYQSKRWQELRMVKIRRNPLCELCEEHGVVTPVEEVHHKISFMRTQDVQERARLAYDIDNLQSLCRSCHQYQHGIIKAEDTKWYKSINSK